MITEMDVQLQGTWQLTLESQIIQQRFLFSPSDLWKRGRTEAELEVWWSICVIRRSPVLDRRHDHDIGRRHLCAVYGWFLSAVFLWPEPTQARLESSRSSVSGGTEE